MYQKHKIILLVLENPEQEAEWAKALSCGVDLRVYYNEFSLLQDLNKNPKLEFALEMVIDASRSMILSKALSKRGLCRLYRCEQPCSLNSITNSQARFVRRDNSDSTWSIEARQKKCEELLYAMAKRANYNDGSKLKILADQIQNGIRLLETLYYSESSAQHQHLIQYINESPRVAYRILKKALEH